MKFRHELKYRINEADRYILRMRLESALARDVHSGADGSYRVSSLYFDTPYDEALFEKSSGVDPREKFRIRTYPDSETAGAESPITLEKKIKQGGLVAKRSELISREDRTALSSGMIDSFAEDERELVREFFAKMRTKSLASKSLVNYRREAYTHQAGNVRITLDSDIRISASGSSDLLLPAAPGLGILEIKYDEFIPDYITKLLDLGNRPRAAWSKYALSRA